jgi:hypothetical protein
MGAAPAFPAQEGNGIDCPKEDNETRRLTRTNIICFETGRENLRMINIYKEIINWPIRFQRL